MSNSHSALLGLLTVSKHTTINLCLEQNVKYINYHTLMFDNKINWRKREIVLVNPDPTFEKEADYNKSVVLHGPNSPRYAVFSEPIHIA